MPRLSLSCLGPFQVTLDGQPVTSFKSNKVRALLLMQGDAADAETSPWAPLRNP
ncbi:MAG: hypothetical protein PVF47_10080 [Anaerolineae bacterium]|jgi:hypothetical protein